LSFHFRSHAICGQCAECARAGATDLDDHQHHHEYQPKRQRADVQPLNMMKQTHGEERQWYAVLTYSGYEDAVARNLKQRVESFGMTDKIFQVVVPVEKKIKIKNGRRTETREKIFPGYVLVDMIASDDAWSVVRNTPQVTGFVG